MPTTIKDADGNDLEVFTADEVKAQNEAALTKYQEEHPDQSSAIQAANDAKAAAEKALADAVAAGGGDTKDENIKALRVGLKAAEDKAIQVETKALAEIAALRNAPTQEYRGELLGTVAQGDAVLKEKIEIKYASLAGMPETTKAEVRARMEEALKLAIDNYRPGMFDGGVSGMGVRGNGGMPQTGDKVHVTENGAAIAAALGITNEQAIKFAPKPGQPGYQG